MIDKLDTLGLEDFDKKLKTFGDTARIAAKIALNSAVRKSHSVVKKDIIRRVNIKSSYIGSVDHGRLSVGKYATDSSLTASLDARKRGTMLYRFMVGKWQKGSSASVMVTRGKRKLLKRAFPIVLRRGNIGLAQRVAGDPDRHPKSKGAVKLGKGLFLLYAPSISQIMTTTLTKETYIQKQVMQHMNAEFIRQLARLT